MLFIDRSERIFAQLALTFPPYQAQEGFSDMRGFLKQRRAVGVVGILLFAFSSLLFRGIFARGFFWLFLPPNYCILFMRLFHRGNFPGIPPFHQVL